MNMLYENFAHVLIALVCNETKLKSVNPVHHQILLFIGSFVSCLYSVWCNTRDIALIYDLVDMETYMETPYLDQCTSSW